MDLHIIDSAAATTAQLVEFYDAVLAPSFPATELVTRDVLFADLRAEGTSATAALAVDEHGAVVGGAVGRWFPLCGVMLTEYLVARPDRRGSGIGGTVLRAVMGEWTARFGPALVLGEVEDPRHHGDAGFGDPARRLRFYLREGAEILDVPYFQPALHGDGTRVPHLLLMVFAAAPEARRGGGVAAEPVRCFVRANLLGSEGRIGADRPTAALLSALAEPTVALVDPGTIVP